MKIFNFYTGLKIAVTALAITTCSAFAMHPNLVITQSDVEKMRSALNQSGRFNDRYLELKQHVDQQLAFGIVVPLPKDHGYNHRHHL